MEEQAFELGLWHVSAKERNDIAQRRVDGEVQGSTARSPLPPSPANSIRRSGLSSDLTCSREFPLT